MCIMEDVQMANNLFPYFTIMDQLAAARETNTVVCRISLWDNETVWTQFPIW